VSSVTVTDSDWNGKSFLQGDVVFEFFSDVRIEVTCIGVDLNGQGSDPVGSTCEILQPHLHSGSHTRE